MSDIILDGITLDRYVSIITSHVKASILDSVRESLEVKLVSRHTDKSIDLNDISYNDLLLDIEIAHLKSAMNDLAEQLRALNE